MIDRYVVTETKRGANWAYLVWARDTLADVEVAMTQDLVRTGSVGPYSDLEDLIHATEQRDDSSVWVWDTSDPDEAQEALGRFTERLNRSLYTTCLERALGDAYNE